MNQEHIKFRWSHQARWHRMGVRIFNTLMRWLPFSIKYGIGKRIRSHSAPYSLIQDCEVVVQIGAPRDTLEAGRSRAMYFALFSDPLHRVILIEPDPDSTRLMEKTLKQRDIKNVSICTIGAWSEKKNLKLYINDAHPASNFTEGLVNYDDKRMKEYRIFEVPVDTVDHILSELGVQRIDMISITTNGAEREILQGMRKTLEAGIRYVVLARTGDNYIQLMEKLGYKLLAHDDRGYTFQRTEQ